MNYSSMNNRSEKSNREASRLFAALPKNYIDQIVSGKIELLCVDFGHGESTAARMKIQKDINGNKTYKVVSVNTSENEPMYKHPTYIYVPDGGSSEKVTIGITAFNRAQSGVAGDFYCDFKRMPSAADNYAKAIKANSSEGRRMQFKELMREYLQAYFDLISTESVAKQNDMDSNKPVILMIGRPAGSKWELEEQEYKEIFLGLTVFGNPPLETFVISESFAALAQSVNDSENIDYTFEDTIVCIDMGSSTADITCMCRGEIVYEYGISLGAHIIEENMLKYIISEASRKYEETYTENDIVDGRAMVLPELRKHKENFFGDATKPPVTNARMRLDLDNGSGEETATVRLTEEAMNKICREMPIRFKDRNAPNGVNACDSWYDGCRDFFKKACADIYGLVDGGLSPIKNIIITGGASRMGFIKELVEEIFGQSSEIGRHNHRDFSVYSSIEPSYTVSKGLTWIAYNAARTEQILARVKGSLKDTVELNSSERIYDDIAAPMVSLVYNQVDSEIHMWAKRNSNESINGFLASRVDPACADRLSSREMRDFIGEKIIAWYREGGVDTDEIIRSVTNQFSKMFGVKLDKIDFTIPDDIIQRAASEAAQTRISLQSSPLVRSAISVFFLLDWWYDLDRVDYLPANRETYARRWSEKAESIKMDLGRTISSQLSCDGRVKGCIDRYFCNVMEKAIDEKINGISMYCFKVNNGAGGGDDE